MKKQLVLITVLLIIGTSLFGQRYEQKSLKIEMHLKEPNSAKTRKYELETFSYYLSIDQAIDSIKIDKSEVHIGVNCYLADELDTFLLQWIAQSPKYLDGEIVITDIMANQVERKIVFTKAYLTGHNESFSKGSSYRAGADFTISFKTISVNDVAIAE